MHLDALCSWPPPLLIFLSSAFPHPACLAVAVLWFAFCTLSSCCPFLDTPTRSPQCLVLPGPQQPQRESSQTPVTGREGSQLLKRRALPLQGSFFTRNSSRAIHPPPTRTMTVLRRMRTSRSCWESPNCGAKNQSSGRATREAQLLPAAGCTRARRDHACHYATGNSVVPNAVIGLSNASTISPDMLLWIKCLAGTNL